MGLQQIAAAKAVHASPYPQRTAYDPLAELAAGRWPGEAVFRHHSIDHQLILDTWVTGAAAEAAADWSFSPDGPSDKAYLRYALHCRTQGWSVIPETRGGTEDRKPPLLEWQSQDAFRRLRKQSFQVLPSNQYDKLPPLWEVMTLAERSVCHNVAVVLGAASGNTRLLDIDCATEELSRQIWDLSFEILGPTPFVRVGRWPRIGLVYRVEGDDVAIPSIAKSFLGPDGEPELDGKNPLNAIEFLSAKHNFTAYGLHHKTGETFDWSHGSLHPAIAPPTAAPLITKAQLNKLMIEIEMARKFAGGGARTSSPIGGEAMFTSFEGQHGGNHKFWIPKVANGSWIRDADGTIVDGRKAYLVKAAWATAGANISTLHSYAGPRGITQPIEFLRFNFQAHARDVISNHDGKYPATVIDKLALSNLNSAIRKFRASLDHHVTTGSYIEGAVPRRLTEDGEAVSSLHLPSLARPADGQLDWLPEKPSSIAELSGTSKVRSVILATKTPAEIEADRENRALISTLEQHEAEHDRVAVEIDAVAAEFFDAVLDYEGEGLPPLYVLSSPTGSGKTSRVGVAALGAFCRKYPRQPGKGPWLVPLPSHANIAEALASAERNGMIVPNPSDLNERELVADLGALGVKACVMKGKTYADPLTGVSMCKRVEEIKALRAAGIGASNLCGARVDDEDEIIARAKRKKGEKVKKAEVFCPFRERGECEYWAQMEAIEQADIVFVPHSYLTMAKPPKVLTNPSGVIIDETINYRVLHQMRMPLSVLDKPRPLPTPTKAELAGGGREDVAHSMLHNRDAVAKTAKDAFLDGKCPAVAIREAGQVEAVADAIKVCSRAHLAERSLTPLMTREQVLAMTAEHVQHGQLIEEEKLWRIIADRLEMLEAGTAKGEREMRLQLVRVMDPVEGLVPMVRLSWRSKPNWVDAPMLLLDASASPKILEKVFGRKPVVRDVAAHAHVRTIALIERPYSNRAYMPPPDALEAEVELARKTTKATHALIDKVSAVYAHSRVLVGSTVAVRQHLVSDDWKKPQNVDAVHYGGLRGKDGFKHHAAAISVGRSEQPIHIIDGFAAALTYDDDVPEQPYDRRGDGLVEVDGKLKPLFRTSAERKLLLRAGHDVSHFVPEMPGVWARELEQQWREEELRQFVGRLRPVYRGADEASVMEPPIWICMSKSVPEDVIVDEVIVLDDLVKDATFWQLLKATNCIFSPAVVETNEAAKALLGGKTPREFAEENFKAKVGNGFIARWMAACSIVDYSIGDRHERAMVPAWRPDPVEALREALPGIDPVIRQVAKPNRELDAKPRAAAPDWVDLETVPATAPVASTLEKVEPAEVEMDPLTAAIHRIFPGARTTSTLSDVIPASTIQKCSSSTPYLIPRSSAPTPASSSGVFSGRRLPLASLRRPMRSVAIP